MEKQKINKFVTKVKITIMLNKSDWSNFIA